MTRLRSLPGSANRPARYWLLLVCGVAFSAFQARAAGSPPPVTQAARSSQATGGAPRVRSDRSLSGNAPRQVLILYAGDRLLSSNTLFDESLRLAFAQGARESLQCDGEFLDEVRFPDGYQERMRDLLRAKYAGHPPDVIVAVGSSSLAFCLRHRSDAFPGVEVPIVFAVSGGDSAASRNHSVTGVLSSFDGPATLRLALRLHPHTRQVFVITSARPDSADGGPETMLLSSTLHEAPGAPIPFPRLSAQPLSALLDTLRRLPENSLVIDLSDPKNAARQGIPLEVVSRRISEASTAPVYGTFDPLAGEGFVGAVTTPLETVGWATGAMVLKVLSRSDAEALPAVEMLAAKPLIDWRQLRRWAGLRQLPPDSVVRFRPPSFWRQHLLLVVTTSVLFLLQSGLILSLVLQSRRRHRAEIEVRRRREELAHMTRVATMGELTASLAHEINQPLTAILSNAQAAQRLLSSGSCQLDEISEILTDIAADDQRAGEVIRRMRALIRKGEFSPTELEVNDLVDEVIGLLRGELIIQNVALALDLSPHHLPVHGDRVQLQQVLLNLMVNAMDAMKDSSGGIRRLVVRTAPSGDRAVEVSIRDSGVGLPADLSERVFEPLFTTKPQGLGLGLAICRSIIQAHGGRIGSRNNDDRGATFWFTLPVLEEAKS